MPTFQTRLIASLLSFVFFLILVFFAFSVSAQDTGEAYGGTYNNYTTLPGNSTAIMPGQTAQSNNETCQDADCKGESTVSTQNNQSAPAGSSLGTGEGAESNFGTGEGAGSRLGTEDDERQTQGDRNSKSLNNPLKSQSLEDLFNAILSVIMVLAVPIIVFFIIYAGFLYVTARGNSEQVQTATRALTYAIVGALIILGSKVLIEVIKGTISQF